MAKTPDDATQSDGYLPNLFKPADLPDSVKQFINVDVMADGADDPDDESQQDEQPREPV
jgi:hypothetical protein